MLPVVVARSFCDDGNVIR